MGLMMLANVIHYTVLVLACTVEHCHGTFTPHTSIPSFRHSTNRQTQPQVLSGRLSNVCAIRGDVVLDVRRAVAYDSGHLPCAINYPRPDFTNSTAGDNDSVSEVLTLVDYDLAYPIQIYCYVGNWAGQIQLALKLRGFTNVTNAGGYNTNYSLLSTLCSRLNSSVTYCPGSLPTSSRFITPIVTVTTSKNYFGDQDSDTNHHVILVAISVATGILLLVTALVLICHRKVPCSFKQRSRYTRVATIDVSDAEVGTEFELDDNKLSEELEL